MSGMDGNKPLGSNLTRPPYLLPPSLCFTTSDQYRQSLESSSCSCVAFAALKTYFLVPTVERIAPIVAFSKTMKKGFGLRRSKNDKTSKKVIDGLKTDNDFQRNGLTSSSVCSGEASSARGSLYSKRSNDSSLSNASSVGGLQSPTIETFSRRQRQKAGTSSRHHDLILPLPPPLG
jgi:hypothetical protein